MRKNRSWRTKEAMIDGVIHLQVLPQPLVLLKEELWSEFQIKVNLGGERDEVHRPQVPAVNTHQSNDTQNKTKKKPVCDSRVFRLSDYDRTSGLPSWCRPLWCTAPPLGLANVVYSGSVNMLLCSNVFHLVAVSFSSPVPQALRLAWHTEAVPVVGEVAVNTQENRESLARIPLPSPESNI